MAEIIKAATRDGYGKALVELGAINDKLVVLDADLAEATKTAMFKKAYPDRFFDTGIAECNMIGVAGGLSTIGYTVFASSFAMFAAGKAFTGILCWRHIERGGLVAMERTQPYIVYASFPKGNEFGNNVHNVCSIQYPVYGRLIDHKSSYFLCTKVRRFVIFELYNDNLFLYL